MPKFKFHVIVYTFIACLFLFMLGACSSTQNKEPSGDTGSLQGLQTLGTPSTHEIDKEEASRKIRYMAIQETALSIGAQAGLAARAEYIDKQLAHRADLLEKIYNFNALILNHNVLPPVLQEGRNEFNLADPETIRISDRRYKILKQAHFITTAPNWRQYLWLDYRKPDKPDVTLLPKDSAEQAIWDHYVTISWARGTHQANVIFSDNIARLKRDFKGMILYRKLLTQNMVSPPYVARTELGVTGDPSEIHVDDQVLRISALPALNVDSKTWLPALASDKEALTQYHRMERLASEPEPKLLLRDPGWSPVIPKTE